MSYNENDYALLIMVTYLSLNAIIFLVSLVYALVRRHETQKILKGSSPRVTSTTTSFFLQDIMLLSRSRSRSPSPNLKSDTNQFKKLDRKDILNVFLKHRSASMFSESVAENKLSKYFCTIQFFMYWISQVTWV